MSVYYLPGTFLNSEDTMIVLLIKFTFWSRKKDDKQIHKKFTFEFHVLINAILKIKMGQHTEAPDFVDMKNSLKRSHRN